MAFKSQAQRAKFQELLQSGKISQEVFDKWENETGTARLPPRAKPTYKPAGLVRRPRRTK